MYQVNLWGSDPRHNNDDCWTGLDFATLAEAKAVFDDPSSAHTEHFRLTAHERGTVFIELARVDDANVAPLVVRRLRADSPPTHDGSRREAAMEAGMLHGVRAYNEVMGWD